MLQAVNYRGLSEYFSLHLKQGKLKVKCAKKALSSVQTKFILLIGVWRIYHDLILQINKTRGREVRETYLGSIDSKVKMKTNGGSHWSGLFRTKRSDIDVG